MHTLREDCVRVSDGNLNVCCMFPASVTVSRNAVQCCAESFCKLYGISSKTRVKLKNFVVEGIAVEENEVSEMKTAKGEARRHNCLLWMQNEFCSLCDILPTADYSAKDYHLPKCVSKISLYAEYCVQMSEEAKEHGPEFKPYSRATFLKLWKQNYPYVTIPVHTAFSVCMTCAMLHDELLTATKSKDKTSLVSLKGLRRTHLNFVSLERLDYRSHQKLARERPDEYCSICIDSMDQAKLRSPHYAGGGLPKSAFEF